MAATAAPSAPFSFKPATRKQLKLRMAIDGPAGAGKTYTALRFAHMLGKRVAVIDSENRSASKYVGEAPDGIPWGFDVLELADYAPTMYTEAIQLAGQAGYDVLVIDSLSHAWTGTGGALEIVDKKKNKFTDGWREVTPLHNRMIDAILACPCHVIVTMRTKTEYVLEVNQKGQTVPRKVGMAPIQRQGMEYEFDIVGDIDQEHLFRVSKSRCSAVDGACSVRPGASFMVPVLHWLEKGTVPPEVIQAAGLTFGAVEIGGGANGAGNGSGGAEKKDVMAMMKAAAAPVAAPQAAAAPAVESPPFATEAAAPAPPPAPPPPAPPPAPPPPAPPPSPPPSSTTYSTDPQRRRLKELFDKLGWNHEKQLAICQKVGVQSFRSFTVEQADQLIKRLIAKLDEHKLIVEQNLGTDQLSPDLQKKLGVGTTHAEDEAREDEAREEKASDEKASDEKEGQPPKN